MDDDLPRIFIVRGESGRMCRLRHFVGLDFLQSVDALAVGVEGIHKMHPVDRVSKIRSTLKCYVLC